MSFAAGSSRASRSRILAIGDPTIVDGAEIASRNIEVVANMYEAIGEIAASTAAEPIEMIVIDERAAEHPLEVIAESVHRLDPGVLVYLLVKGDGDGSARRRALAARFDGVLEAPLSPAALVRDLDDPATHGLRPPPAAPRIAAPMDEEETGEATAAAIEVDREFETARDEANEAISQQRQPLIGASRALRSPGAQNRPQPLGDIDIVEAMLDEPARGLEIALALIEQETGWRELEFIPVSDPGSGFAEPDEAAPVALRGVTHGLLRAGEVSRQALEPWAAWLARWAALAAAQRELSQMARCDSLTGAGNRRCFDEFLPRVLEEAKQRRRQIPLMVFDVDNLKLFNDRHGHEAGDTVLRETVRLLQSIIRKGDQVFRIGGDEFVVVFADPDPPRKPGSGVIESVETIARRFQTEICLMKFPKLGPEAPGTLSISAGLATYPWDGGDADTLLRVADQLALDSKRGGKNALTIGPGAAKLCAQDSDRVE